MIKYVFTFAYSGSCMSIAASNIPLHAFLSSASCSPSLISRILRWSSLTRSIHRMYWSFFFWSSYCDLVWFLALHSLYTIGPAYCSVFENSHYGWLAHWILVLALCVRLTFIICILLLVSKICDNIIKIRRDNLRYYFVVLLIRLKKSD